MGRHAVHRGGHGELSHAVVDVAARMLGGEGGHGGFRVGVVGAGEVGRTADHLGHGGGQHLQGVLARLARGELLGIVDQPVAGLLDDPVEIRREPACDAALELGAPVGGEVGEALLPGVAALGSLAADGAPAFEQVVGDDEGLGGPAEGLARGGDLLGAQRRAVGLFGALLLRRAVADDRLHVDQRRALRLGPGLLQRLVDLVGHQAVAGHDVPAERAELRRDVVGEGERGGAVDADGIVVVEYGQLAELEVPGERRRLLADALHQAPVAAEAVGAVVDHVAAEGLGEDPFGHRHPDGGAEALAERSRRRLDPLGHAVFRVAGGLRAVLAEVLDLLDRHVLVAGQIEQAVEHHRGMAVRQDDPVAIRPVGGRGVELQVLLVEDGRRIGHAHRRAGMPGVRLLDGVHGKGADAVRHLRLRADRRLFVHDAAPIGSTSVRVFCRSLYITENSINITCDML